MVAYLEPLHSPEEQEAARRRHSDRVTADLLNAAGAGNATKVWRAGVTLLIMGRNRHGGGAVATCATAETLGVSCGLPSSKFCSWRYMYAAVQQQCCGHT